MSLSVAASRRRLPIAILAVAALAALSLVAATSTSAAGSDGKLGASIGARIDPTLRGLDGTTRILVQGARSTEAAVSRLGGTITHQLPLIRGYSATLPADRIEQFAGVAGVRSITRDSPMRVMSAKPTMAAGGVRPPDVYQESTGARQLKAAGDNGHGVTVAVIDTGVTSMPDTSSRLVSVATDPLGLHHADCVNFAGDGTCTDEYGHGTFLAGLIAGTGAASGGQYAGVAPGAKILAVKAAGADGAADVSTIIAALQWVVAFKNTYNIKVVNLSLGTDGTQTYQLSPLDYAVEKVWKSGIVADVSASNLGPNPRTVDKPADDPYVITVGATDDRGTSSRADDTVPPWSGRGPTAADNLAKPDVAAPGVGLISLAAPGAEITTQYPPAMAAPYRQGSGTSMSTAVVSGLVADILSAKPGWSPDRVKYALTSTAGKVANTDPNAVGAGEVNGYAALGAPAGLANQNIAPATGLGSLQADRGTVSVTVDGVGTAGVSVVSGEVTAQLTPWNALTMLIATFSGNSWWGNSWWGNSWWEESWNGNSWWGNSWWGNSWWGNSWWGAQWYGFWQ